MGDFLTGQSRVSRRGLLKGASVMGAAILLAPMSANRAAAQPKKGGILRIGFNSGSTTDSYDPGTFDSNFNQVFAQSRHDG